jgi:RND superfamily putative drug exporter
VRHGSRERGKGFTAREAAGRAVGTAGSSVVFAGLTVIIALAGLAVVGIPMLTKMGLAAAGAVAIAVAASLTLVPAVLGFWPIAVLARRTRKRQAGGEVSATMDDEGRTKDGRESMGTRWARFVLRRPLPVLILGVIGLGALALPAASLELGMPGDEALSTSTPSAAPTTRSPRGSGPASTGR